MRFSALATRTSKTVSQDDPSRNAQLLTKAGYVNRLMAGVYNYLPLGLRVLAKIENIVREEMNAVGGQEVLLPALQPKEPWETTGRWDKIDVMFKLTGAGDRELCLGPTHEEIVTPLVGQFIHSYRDLPKSVYQIQTKFRNEARSKSGLLRGREFRMKDLYSFHVDQADLDAYYEKVTEAYKNIYRRVGLGDRTLITYATGGAFSKYSHEFQTVTEYGEDTIYKIPGTDKAINKELLEDMEAMTSLIPGYKAGDALESVKAIEVGNIFKLGTKFSGAFGLSYADAAGKPQPIIMGCYGFGSSRVMGTIAEVLSDDKGLVWPTEVAPFKVHLVSLFTTAEEAAPAEALYNELKAKGVDVLWDDRLEARAGEKFADADLIGIPHRVLISKKSIEKGGLEYKARSSAEAQMISTDKLFELIAK